MRFDSDFCSSGSVGSLTGNPPSVNGGFGQITNVINTGAVGTGALCRFEFMFRGVSVGAGFMPAS
jgi:hypothetical protein